MYKSLISALLLVTTTVQADEPLICEQLIKVSPLGKALIVYRPKGCENEGKPIYIDLCREYKKFSKAEQARQALDCRATFEEENNDK